MSRSRRIRLLDGLRALGRVWRDPTDTASAFEVLDALDGPLFAGRFHRFRATRAGRRILDEERDLLMLLADRSWLEALPEGSLGRVFADVVEDVRDAAPHGDAGGEGGAIGFGSWLDERSRFEARQWDQRGLEWVVTGYGNDAIDTGAFFAFRLGQCASFGAALVVATAALRSGADGHRLLLAAHRRGRRAAWLAATDWESLLELPLAEVRALLGVGDPPASGDVEVARTPAAA